MLRSHYFVVVSQIYFQCIEMHVFCIASAIVKPVVDYTVTPQSINQSIKFLCGLSSGIIARSTGDSQLMSSMQSGKDFLTRAAQQFLMWGVEVRERSERKNFFWPPPHLWLTWGDIKQDISVFITTIMTYKRICLPAPNDYNIGLCDYCGYGETETVKECHFWVLVTVYYINVA